MIGPRTRTRARRWAMPAGAVIISGAVWGAVALGADNRPAGDFSAILGEMRSAVAHTSDLRGAAERSGDGVKAKCAYERLRGIMQAVDSAQVAQVAWESAKARGDEAAAQAELSRAQGALELVRRMRNEADGCVGVALGQKAGGGTPGVATVTVESTVRDDDPNAGPVESWSIRPPRLDLPLRPVPASPF